MKANLQELQKLNGSLVKIITTHKWFGKNIYKCLLCLINDNDRIGFCIRNGNVFLLKKDIMEFIHTQEYYYISDGLMDIKIIF